MKLATSTGDFYYYTGSQKESLRLIRAAGFRYAVLHPSGEPIDNADREASLSAAEDSLRTLAQVAREAGITLALENLPRTCLGNCSAELLELIAADDRLRICFDTNHLLGEDISDFIRACYRSFLVMLL